MLSHPDFLQHYRTYLHLKLPPYSVGIMKESGSRQVAGTGDSENLNFDFVENQDNDDRPERLRSTRRR